MPNATRESNYKLRVDASTVQGTFLPGTAIELIREPAGRGGYHHALFDFDGTLSLIRQGWPEIMAPLMVEVLLDTPNHESEEEIAEVVRNLILDTTGKQTIYQMMDLAEEVRRRGGTPLDALDYKQTYTDRLMVHIHDRRESLRSGKVKPVEMLVSHTYELLEGLLAKGVRLYLASGTDEQFVKEEAELVGVTSYFGKHIYGAIEDYQNYSKQMVIERILAENQVEGLQLLGFGDGYVEIDNTKSSGGIGIGVASDENHHDGRPDPWKRERLIGVGADVIVPDFRDHGRLIEYLFPG